MNKQIGRMTEQETVDHFPPQIKTQNSHQFIRKMAKSAEHHNYYSQNISTRGSANDKNIFAMSATTLTRQKAPSFRIPKQKRFKMLNTEIYQNFRFLDLSLEKNIDKGITFAKSERFDHFVKRQKTSQPSCATYFINPEDEKQDLNPHSTQKLSSKIYTSYNSSQRSKFNKTTFNRFSKTHKLYQPHGQRLIYQPQLTQKNPGVGLYNVDCLETKNKSPSYTIKRVLQRFNQVRRNSPGPGAYQIRSSQPHKAKSINQKGTFSQSKRIFLQNINRQIPGPGRYM